MSDFIKIQAMPEFKSNVSYIDYIVSTSSVISVAKQQDGTSAMMLSYTGSFSTSGALRSMS
ncbi:MAG: hypothetical protein PUI65_00245 [Prevotella sp.]|nr:hypothetical protein [Prevotella sp.]